MIATSTRRFLARAAEDWEELVRDPAVEAVVIASPQETHRAIAEAAVALGKPVFCEKPLADTLDVPDMAEKTLRYPGHIDLMRAMRDTGLFSKEPVEVNGVSVVPLELTSKLLFPLWTYEEGEADLTVMRIFGEARGQRVQWDVYDELDPSVNTTSMARTTAFPAAIVARMLADGTISEPGVHAPEAFAGRDDILQRLLSELGERGVRYERTKTSI